MSEALEEPAPTPGNVRDYNMFCSTLMDAHNSVADAASKINAFKESNSEAHPNTLRSVVRRLEKIQTELQKLHSTLQRLNQTEKST